MALGSLSSAIVSWANLYLQCMNSSTFLLNEWMNEESWMRGQQKCPLTIYFNMWKVSSDVSIQRRHWQPLSVHLWAYCTHPTHDVRVDHTTGVYVPYFFRTVLWVLLRPPRTRSVKVLWDGTHGFSSLSEKTRKSNRLQMYYWQRQQFLLSYLKTVSVGQAGVRTHDLPLSRPAFSQRS